MISSPLAYFITAGLVFCAGMPQIPFSFIGAGRHGTKPLELGVNMPAMDSVSETVPMDFFSGSTVGEIARDWSERDLSDWRTQGKVTVPRIILAKLAANRDIEIVNQYLSEAQPWSGAGSTWFLHKGDYDFSLVTLTTVLYLFGNRPERLYPETRAHLLEVLLNQEGGTPLVTVPGTFGLILDTENHHLMTEGSRYLKNQWLTNHGDDDQRNNPAYNNSTNGLGAWLESYLEDIIHEGVYEFNSQPYIGYTLQALLNLEAFPESPGIRQKARYLLDIVNMQYALGSLGLRRNSPFRRRYEKANDTGLTEDSQTAYMHTWLRLDDKASVQNQSLRRYSGHGLLAELLPYRLPEDIRVWTQHKPAPYFVRYGRGPSACPELYSGGPGYLLSAGGAHRGMRSHIIARPITLLLDDGATDLMDCIHVQSKGPWTRWNATGVFQNFACGNGPVHVPAQMEEMAEETGWRVFRASAPRTLLIAEYSQSDLGLIVLFPDEKRSPQALLRAILSDNADSAVLRSRFQWPNGNQLEYDVEAPKGVWVMKSADGGPLDRDYDAWPQFEGDIPPLSFSR